jgi:hypothetical protein
VAPYELPGFRIDALLFAGKRPREIVASVGAELDQSAAKTDINDHAAPRAPDFPTDAGSVSSAHTSPAPITAC